MPILPQGESETFHNAEYQQPGPVFGQRAERQSYYLVSVHPVVVGVAAEREEEWGAPSALLMASARMGASSA
jgi:hypothetical protein